MSTTCYACDAPPTGTRDRAHDVERAVVPACARHQDTAWEDSPLEACGLATSRNLAPLAWTITHRGYTSRSPDQVRRILPVCRSHASPCSAAPSGW